MGQSEAADCICRLHCPIAATCWHMGSFTIKRTKQCSRLSISWGLGSRYLAEGHRASALAQSWQCDWGQQA